MSLSNFYIQRLFGYSNFYITVRYAAALSTELFHDIRPDTANREASLLKAWRYE